MIPVLIVDDSPTVRVMLRDWLSEAGYTTTEACDGLEALDTLRKSHAPLIVLMDYEMPNLNGFEALSRAADEGFVQPGFAYCAISSMAANFPPYLSDLLRLLGAQILPKPFDRESLLEVVQFLERRFTTPAA